MPWVRIHDGALRNLKIAALSDAAFRLWVAGLAHAQEHLTDGEIRREHLSLLAAKPSRKVLTELTTVPAGTRCPLWEVTPNGYQIHDFATWNETRTVVLKKRTATRDRIAKWRAHRDALQTTPRNASGDALQHAPRDALHNAASTTTSTTTPLKNLEGGDDGADAPAPARLLETWNQHRGSLPEAHLTPDRRRASAARLKETPDLGWWASAVDRMAASAFCRGETGRPGWRADYDFLVKPGIAVKVHEGKYDGGLPCCEPTAQELQVATELRRKAWGRCPHEPPCVSHAECVRAIAVDRKAKSA